MVTSLAFLALGTVVLYAGVDTAVRGAGLLSRRLGIGGFAVGALLFGIDLEGLGASVVAAGRDETAIAAGGAFGSVLFLFTAAFGVALVLSRTPIPAPPPRMLAAPALGVAAAALAISDRVVNRVEGILLVLLYAVYVGWVLLDARSERREAEAEADEAAEPPGRRLAPLALTLAGLTGLAIGAGITVEGGSRLAVAAGLTSGFVGAAIIGALTSLEEVLLGVLPVRRGQHELATGNLLGTLAAFTTVIPGLAAIVRPLTLDGAANAAFLGVAVVYAIIATVFFARGRAGRALGVVVFSSYAAWLLYAVGL